MPGGGQKSCGHKQHNANTHIETLNKTYSKSKNSNSNQPVMTVPRQTFPFLLESLAVVNTIMNDPHNILTSSRNSLLHSRYPAVVNTPHIADLCNAFA